MTQYSIQLRDIQLVQDGIRQLLGEIDSFDGLATSGNLVIDSIINYKANIAKKNQIYFSVELLIPQTLNIDAISICQIVGNALDNAIEATAKVDDVAKRIVQIGMNYKQNALFIQIVNPYRGEVVTDSNGHLMSSKRNFRTEGIGLQSIMSVVEKNQGSCIVGFENNQFRLRVTLYDAKDEL